MDRLINPLTGPIGEKIGWGEAMFGCFGEQLLEDTAVSGLLAAFRDAVQASRSMMIRAGMVSLCGSCEREEGGSCCGAGMEDRYDGWLLLVNCLLGVKIPKNRFHSGSCLFLGPDGCRLTARQVICINYLCQKISANISSSDIRALQEKEGVEIECLFLLMERVKKLARGKIG